MRAPRGVIAVLLAVLGITAGRLDVSALVWADPHARPRRRYRERTNAIEHDLVANRPSVGTSVDEPVAAAPASALDARLLITHIAESCRRRCGERTGIQRTLCVRRTLHPTNTRRSKGTNSAHNWPDRAKRPPSKYRTAFRTSALSSPSEF
jgi:hypothetical protein